MNLSHFALAILIVAVWGFNFVVIKIGLNEIPPIALCFVRFFLASFPAIFFVKRPAVPFRTIFFYGLLIKKE